jgi:hypothetical protein
MLEPEKNRESLAGFSDPFGQGPAPPPPDGGLLYLKARLSQTVSTRRRVIFAISVMLFVILLLRRDPEIRVEFGDIAITSLAPVRDFAVLILSLALAELTSIMTDAIGLANSLAARIEFTTTDLESQDIKVADIEIRYEEAETKRHEAFKEGHPFSYALNMQASSLQQACYNAFILSIIVASSLTLGAAVVGMWRAHSLPSPIWQAVLILTIFFMFQSLLSIFQYLALRRARPPRPSAREPVLLGDDFP